MPFATVANTSDASHRGLDDASSQSNRRLVAGWLTSVAILVFVMVVLGGVTRLTGSGLSMTDWQPVSGVLPPMGQAAWAEEFARYQQSPEFKHVNYWMTVSDFKRIFWFEYAHRVLGRLIGIVFAIPLVLFAIQRRIPIGLGLKLTGLFVLGGLQGLLGWYMVKSGLVDVPHVSQYRLAAHLTLAVLIFGYAIWLVLGLLNPPRKIARDAVEVGRYSALARGGAVVTGLALVTLLSGAFVAGLKAGLVYNTFPLMGESFVPDGLFAMQPWYMNALENVTTVQFNHRILAITTFFAVIVLTWRALAVACEGVVRGWAVFAMAAAVAQVTLGITTLLLKVPISVGAAHQGGALVLITALLGLTFHLSRPGVRAEG